MSGAAAVVIAASAVPMTGAWADDELVLPPNTLDIDGTVEGRGRSEAVFNEDIAVSKSTEGKIYLDNFNNYSATEIEKHLKRTYTPYVTVTDPLNCVIAPVLTNNMGLGSIKNVDNSESGCLVLNYNIENSEISYIDNDTITVPKNDMNILQESNDKVTYPISESGDQNTEGGYTGYVHRIFSDEDGKKFKTEYDGIELEIQGNTTGDTFIFQCDYWTNDSKQGQFPNTADNKISSGHEGEIHYNCPVYLDFDNVKRIKLPFDLFKTNGNGRDLGVLNDSDSMSQIHSFSLFVNRQFNIDNYLSFEVPANKAESGYVTGATEGTIKIDNIAFYKNEEGEFIAKPVKASGKNSNINDDGIIVYNDPTGNYELDTDVVLKRKITALSYIERSTNTPLNYVNEKVVGTNINGALTQSNYHVNVKEDFMKDLPAGDYYLVFNFAQGNGNGHGYETDYLPFTVTMRNYAGEGTFGETDIKATRTDVGFTNQSISDAKLPTWDYLKKNRNTWTTVPDDPSKGIYTTIRNGNETIKITFDIPEEECSHVYGDKVTIYPDKIPTKDNPGKGYVVCEKNEEHKMDVDLPKLDDTSATGWKQTKAPTCEEPGELTYTVKVKDGNGKEHDATVTMPIAPAGEHKFETITVPAKCEKQGSETKICSVCGKMETTVIPAEEHEFGKWVKIKDPTLTAPGLRQKTCIKCGKVVTETLPPLSSDEWNRIKSEKPGEDTAGKDTYKWVKDEGYNNLEHDGIVTIQTPPTGYDCHPEDQWHIEKMPTATEPGLAYRGCDMYNPSSADSKHIQHVEFAELPPIGDSRWQWHTKPGCETEGSGIIYNCPVDKWENGELVTTNRVNVEITNIAPIGHDYYKWEVQQPENDTEKVKLIGICSRDESHKKFEDLLPPLSDGNTWLRIKDVPGPNPITSNGEIHDEYILIDPELIAKYNKANNDKEANGLDRPSDISYYIGYQTKYSAAYGGKLEINDGIIKIFMPANSKTPVTPTPPTTSTVTNSGGGVNDFDFSQYMPCDHDYKWSVKEQPKDKTSPITLVGVCDKCGNTIEKVVLGLADPFWTQNSDDFNNAEHDVTIHYVEPSSDVSPATSTPTSSEPQPDNSDISDVSDITSEPEPVESDSDAGETFIGKIKRILSGTGNASATTSVSGTPTASESENSYSMPETAPNGNPYTGITTILVPAGIAAGAIMIAAYHRKHKK